MGTITDCHGHRHGPHLQIKLLTTNYYYIAQSQTRAAIKNLSHHPRPPPPKWQRAPRKRRKWRLTPRREARITPTASTKRTSTRVPFEWSLATCAFFPTPYLFTFLTM